MVKGYNRIILDERVEVKKGQMICVDAGISELIAIDYSDISIISDYYIGTGKSYRMKKAGNTRFYINVLTEDKFYLSYINITRFYSSLKSQTFGVYSLSANFSNSSVSLRRYYNVTNGKYKKFIYEFFTN